MRDRRARLLLIVAAGLAVGSLTSIGQTHLGTTLNPLVNSASAWLVAPFAVGMCMPSRREAAGAGLAVCLLQLAGYYATANLRGFAAGDSIIAFWTACAIAGGPVFGLAGHAWRTARPERRGLGMAALAGAFFAEGLWVYLHELHSGSRTALWLGIGAGLALAMGRRLDELRWLALTVPIGIVCEVLLTQLYAPSL